MKNIELKKITLKNGETYGYRQYIGGEKVVVLIHGNLATSLFYERLMQDLPEEYTIYAMDMRGCGDSTYNRPIDDLRDLAGDLKLFVDALNLKKFDLAGWSTGGAVSMYFTVHFGDMVNRLFLIDAACVSGYHSYGVDEKGNKVLLRSRKEIAEDPSKIELANAYERKDIEYAKKVWSAAIYNVNKPEKEEYDAQLMESMRQQNLVDIYYGLNKFNISDYYNGLAMGTGEAHKITVPTVVIQGDKDLLVPVEEGREIQETIGDNARLVVVKDCGHSPMVDAPDLLADLIAGRA